MNQSDTKETCWNCGVEINPHRDLCPDCERTVAKKNTKKTCAECSTHIPSNKTYCKSCRVEQRISESLSSPGVNKDGSIDYGNDKLQPTEHSRSLYERVSSLSLRSFWIRIVGWMRTLLRFGSIVLFLIGVWAIVTVLNAPAFEFFGDEFSTFEIIALEEPVEFLEYEVPGMFGFTSMQTLLYSGILALMIGLGLAYRWIISDVALRTRY